MATPAPDAATATSLVDLVDRTAGRHPDRPALVDGGVTLTYAEVVARSEQLAERFRARGVRPGMLVGLVVARTHEVPLAVLALFRLGAAYVPLDPAYPPQRLLDLLADARLTVVVGDTASLPEPVLARLADAAAAGTAPVVTEPPGGPGRDDVAYVIYTSGSTGAPKGCLVTHGNVLSLLAGSLPLLEVGPDDRWSLFHAASFDVSVYELWSAWATGATGVVVPERAAHQPAELATVLGDRGVTVLSLVPSVFRHLVREPDFDPDRLRLRYVLFAGESVQLDVVEEFAARAAAPPRMVNLYGITEITVHATFKVLTPGGDPLASSPIGRELPHLRIVLRDDDLAPVAAGDEGEIWVYGPAVALGYLDRPELTAQRFRSCPDDPPGERGYRSGDMARRRPDGELDYLGRRDEQIKLNGFRIELGEIESALRAHPAVAQVAVLATGPTRHARALRAVYVPREVTAVPPAAELEAWAADRLPAYMVPRAYDAVAALPSTPSGKLDRQTLAAALAARDPTIR